MSSLFLIFNHQMTPLQEEDARRSLEVDRIIDLPEDLQALWRQIPADLIDITDYLAPIGEWLTARAQEGDYVLIQGDFGACFMVVNLALKLGLIPVYSTTEREAVEVHGEDGTVTLTHQFRHRIFRRYGE